MSQRFSTDHGMVDERGQPIVAEEAPAENPEDAATLAAAVDDAVAGAAATEEAIPE